MVDCNCSLEMFQPNCIEWMKCVCSQVNLTWMLCVKLHKIMGYIFQHNIANFSLCIFAWWPQAYSHFLNYFYDGVIRILNTTPHEKLAWVVQLDWNNDVRLTLYQQPRLALNFSSNHISHQLLSADLWIESYCGITYIMNVLILRIP